MTDEMTRREFCTKAGQCISLVAIGSMAPGCSGGDATLPSNVPSLPTVSGTVATGVLTVQVAGSALATVGSAARVNAASAGTLLIARTSTDTFSAVTAVCTHEQCSITGYTNQVYVCPCHGSRFNTTGSVVTGPASSPLRQYSTQFASDVLTVTL